VSLAALLDPFQKVLLEKLELSSADFPEPNNPAKWPAYREKMATIFRTRPRDEWVALFEESDACVVPVLDLEEAPQHPHNRARGTFVEHDGVVQPAPAPRFSRTPSEIRRRPPAHGEHTDQALQEWGLSAEAVQDLRTRGAFG
jgi:alpha-methylacyl-CoA racemase